MTSTDAFPRPELAPSLDATLRVGLRLVEERLLEWTRSPVSFLEEGSHRILEAGGKRFRPSVCLLAYLANGGRPFHTDVLDAAAMLELLHTATLVHDDIIDDADTRRGLPSAHRQYGTSRAILIGDHLLSAGFHALPRLEEPVQRSLLEAARLLAEGEAMEMELTRAGAATLEDYFLVIAKKTASLLEAATACGARIARPDGTGVESFSEFGFHAGVAFQLVDDLLDVEGVTEVTGKPTQWDLSRGVPNAAVLMTLEADLRGKPAAVRLPSGMERELDAVRERMSQIGGDERVRRLARMYSTRALEALEPVRGTEAGRFLAAQVEAGLTRLH
jgi:octaprenyl-diphosphate synthase